MGLFKKTPQQMVAKAVDYLNQDRNEEGVALLRKAVEENYGPAWYYLGRCYFEGWGVEESDQLAADYYFRAADLGVDEAWMDLALCYRHSDDEAVRSIYKALLCYEQAASRGSVEAMYEMGAIHSSGIGVIQDIKEGLKWYHMAAERNCGEAMSQIAQMYAYGNDLIEKDEDKARAWFEKAVSADKFMKNLDIREASRWLLMKSDPDSAPGLFDEEEALEVANDLFLHGEYELCCRLCEGMAMADDVDLDARSTDFFFGNGWEGLAQPYHFSMDRLTAVRGELVYETAEDYWDLGEEMCEEKHFEAANIYYKKAADLGMPRALSALGNNYALGRGVEKDKVKAASIYKEAAELGCWQAMANLGNYYQKGEGGLEQNTALAIAYLTMAAEEGDWAAYKLGDIYENGDGVGKDLDEAVKWYEKGAELGRARAAYNLAWIYRTGEGKYKRPDKMLEFYEKAAKLDRVGYICRELGELYMYGDLIENDYDRAEKYLIDAAALGDKKCFDSLGDLYSLERCGKSDGAKALYWFKKAAEEGDSRSQEILGNHYKKLGDNDYMRERSQWWLKKAEEQKKAQN